jgi:cytochrome c oxidase cbb3-type subunit 3
MKVITNNLSLWPNSHRWQSILLALLLALSSIQSVAASRIVLIDGTVIHGEVESMANGRYVINSPTLGRLELSHKSIRSIWPDRGPGSNGIEFENQIKRMSAKEILKDPTLLRYTLASAKALFGDNCAACHGGGGQGNPGFPVLADDDWLYGGTIETIEQTVTWGRKGIMTAHGKVLSKREVDSLTDAIMAKNPTSDPNFTAKGCIACHGIDGKGMAVLGSANLTDNIYRFMPKAGESQRHSVKYTIMHGVNDATDPKTREAAMPAFGELLSNEDIRKLAVYVHKLGGGL